MQPIGVYCDSLIRARNRRRFRHLDTDDQQVIFLPQQRVVYYPIPKVACSSLEAVCADILGAELPPDEWKPELFRSPRYVRLVRSRGWLISVVQAEQLVDCWKFAFVRNPWDRLVSCYSEKIREGDADNFVDGISKVLVPYGMFWKNMTFEDFVKAVARIPDSVADGHLRSQHTFLLDHQGRIRADFVGRFERLRADFETVTRQLGVRVELPHLLASTRGDYRDYYTNETRQRVASRYASDIELFGYLF